MGVLGAFRAGFLAAATVYDCLWLSEDKTKKKKKNRWRDRVIYFFPSLMTVLRSLSNNAIQLKQRTRKTKYLCKMYAFTTLDCDHTLNIHPFFESIFNFKFLSRRKRMNRYIKAFKILLLNYITFNILFYTHIFKHFR